MPSNVDDPVLGSLVWEDRQSWWVGETNLRPELAIDVFIDFDPEKQIEAEVLAQARAGLLRLRRREGEYRLWTAEQLLDIHWADEPMGTKEIADILNVASVLFPLDGSSRVYWNDNDVLFGGNNLITTIGADGECIEAGGE